MTTIARWIALNLAAAVASLALPAIAAEAPEPTDRHRASARIIVELLANHHYRERELDDELSRAALDAYLDGLDPERFYFRASDIADFQRYRNKLDDQLREGRLEAAWSIFEVYRERVRERSEYARELLASGLNLDDPEVYRIDRDEAEWAASRQAQNELWRKRIENDILSLKLADDGSDADPPRETLEERYAQLARNLAQYTADDVFEIYMNAWSRLFDPHTSYLSARTRENFNINMSLSLQGIGAMLTTRGQYTEVTELVTGGPADKDGELSAGDRIVAVGQEDEDMVSVVGWRLGDVVQRIRGPKGSVVRLEVLSGNSGARKIIDITRNEIVLDDRAAKSRVLTVESDADRRRIGIIELPSFYHDFSPEDGTEGRSTTEDVAELVADLQSGDGIDGLVIDLRDNAGGSLQEATKLTGLFIEDGPVVQVRYSDGERNVLRDNDRGLLAYDGPLTVVVNGGSASASEIFAGAIQDYGRGLILGGQTFGKGTVQDLVDLNRYQFAEEGRAGSIKFTRAKYYRITGASTQRRGIRPDVGMDALLNERSGMTERAEENSLPWDEIDAASFERVGDPARFAERLQARHGQRVAELESLKALRRERELMQQVRDRETVTLEATERRAQRQEREAARLQAANARLEALGLDPIENLDELDRDELPDLIAREAARITADFITLNAGEDLPASDVVRTVTRQ